MKTVSILSGSDMLGNFSDQRSFVVKILVQGLTAGAVLIGAQAALHGQSIAKFNYHIVCGAYPGDEVISLNTPEEGRLELVGQLKLEDIQRPLQCVYHFDFDKPSIGMTLTKSWSCVEDMFVSDPVTAYFKGFYFVELFQAGLAVDVRADISKVNQGIPEKIGSEDCWVRPGPAPGL